MTPDALLSLVCGATVAGKYRLMAPLASGGMGAVWTAIHIELGVLVAIKFIDPEEASSDVARKRFAREAMSAAALHHPHIVDIRDYGVDRGTPYLVMELLRGEALSTRLRREGRLSLRATSVILGQIAKALRVAHEAGVVHRDLKPGNIFLAQVDDDEVVKVLDFGIAKDVRAGSLGDVTRTGEMIGSPHYMSPEQVRGAHDLDRRSDIWSLGVIVFRCLTGRLPFPGDVIGDVIARIVSDPLPIATALAPDLPAPIDSFFACAMARDRGARFPSARDMAAALAVIADGPPAAPVSSPSWSSASASNPAIQAVSSPSFSVPSADAPALAPADPEVTVPTAVLPHAVPWEAPSGTLGGAGSSTAPRVAGRGRAAALVVALLACSITATILWLRRPAADEGAPVAVGAPRAVPIPQEPAPLVEPREMAELPTASAPPIAFVLASAAPGASVAPSASAAPGAQATPKAAVSARRAPAAKKNGLPAVGF